MPLVLLAQESYTSSGFAWTVGLAGLAAVVLSLPLFCWRAKRRWSFALLALLLVGQAALLSDDTVREAYASAGEMILTPVLLILTGLIPPALLLLWRRARRFALAWAGLVVVSGLAFSNYMALVISSIGYLLLLIALWPRWRLLQSAPRGREVTPTVPSRGVLRVRPWPIDGRTARRGERGYSLASALAGVACLVVAFSIAAALISGTTSAVRRADHLAVATDLLESARERALLGTSTDDLARQAAAKLPHGQATLQRTSAGRGLVRITATATWHEPTGRAGQATLEWLALERSR